MGTMTGLMEGERGIERREREPIKASNASSLRRSCLEGRSSTFSLLNQIPFLVKLPSSFGARHSGNVSLTSISDSHKSRAHPDVDSCHKLDLLVNSDSSSLNTDHKLPLSSLLSVDL